MSQAFRLFLLLIFGVGSAQVPVTYKSNPSDLEINNLLQGANVTIFDGVLNYGKRDKQIAVFNGGIGAGLLMDKGVFFNTGFNENLLKNNDNLGQSNSPDGDNEYKDVDLMSIDGLTFSDVVSYSFKVKLGPKATSVNIAYQFGSEEYPDFVGSFYKDTFGFFISGPGVLGTANLAKLPSGNITCINTVNYGYRGFRAMNEMDYYDGTQSQLYINNGHPTTLIDGFLVENDNSGAKPVAVQFNGLTKLINYSISGLVPGATYTFKIAIGDNFDSTNDSGVFIDKISAAAVLQAVDDSYDVFSGSLTSQSVLANDKYNTNVATLSDVILSQISTSNAGVNLDPVTGLVTVLSTTPKGTYDVVYQICDKDQLDNCKTAKLTIKVSDKDNDGDEVSDYFDMDDDNDGILDITECPSTLLGKSFSVFAPYNYYSPSGDTWNISVSGTSGTVVKFNNQQYTIPSSETLLLSVLGNETPTLTTNVVESGKSFSLTSDQPVTVVQELTGSGAASDSWVLLPKELWGKEYQLFSYAYSGNTNNNQYAMIYADQDNTTVKVLDKEGVEQRNIILQKGETYLLSGVGLDMTGWRVTSTNIVGVVVGVNCAKTPSINSYCDNVDEMLLPVQSLGKKFYVPSSANNITYIMAYEANTDVYIDGIKVTSLVKSGDVYSLNVNKNSLKVIETNKKATVWQLTPYETDPSWNLVMDADKGSHEFSFVVPSRMNDKSLLSLIVPSYATSLIRINGNPVSTWQPFPYDNNISYAEVGDFSPSTLLKVSSTTSQVPIISSYLGYGLSANATSFNMTNSTSPSIGNYNISTGEQITQSCNDIDMDGIPNIYDLDSDEDGCSDALEGDENVTMGQLVANRISGPVDANGIPVIVNPGGSADLGGGLGQGLGDAYNALVQSGCFCYKPAQQRGVVLSANQGITSLGRAGADQGNWPMVRKGAWMVLEAKNKGFVVNRLSDEQIKALPSNHLLEGMMVFNTTRDCLQINIDGTESGWKCFNTQTCPD